MDKKSLTSELINLFDTTGKAHHNEFIKQNGADPEWPLWYANHIRDELGNKLNKHFTIGELVYLFISADKSHKHNAPESDWKEYFANFFIEKH